MASNDPRFREGLIGHLISKFVYPNIGQGEELGWILSVAPRYNAIVTEGGVYTYNEDQVLREFSRAYQIADEKERKKKLNELQANNAIIEKYKDLIGGFKPKSLRPDTRRLTSYLDSEEIIEQVRKVSEIPIIFYGGNKRFKRDNDNSIVYIPGGIRGYESIARELRPYLSQRR